MLTLPFIPSLRAQFEVERLNIARSLRKWSLGFPHLTFNQLIKAGRERISFGGQWSDLGQLNRVVCAELIAWHCNIALLAGFDDALLVCFYPQKMSEMAQYGTNND